MASLQKEITFQERLLQQHRGKHQRRNRQEIRAEIGALRKKLRYYENGEDLREIETIIQKYRSRLRALRNEYSHVASGTGKGQRRVYTAFDDVLAKKAASKSKKTTSSKVLNTITANMSMQNMTRMILVECESILGKKPTPVYMNPLDMCSECGSQMIVNAANATLVCPTPDCRIVRHTDTVYVGPMQHVRVADPTDYHAKGKGAHGADSCLATWLEKIQGLEASNQSKECVMALMYSMYKRRSTGLEKHAEAYRKYGPFSSIDDMMQKLPRDIAEETRECLKRMNATFINKELQDAKRMFPGLPISTSNREDHAAKLASCLNGFTPLQLTPQLEKCFQQMFMEYKSIAEIMKPLTNSSMQNQYIPFLLYVWMLFGLDEFLDTVLKPNQNTTLKQEPTIRTIFETLGWEFHSLLQPLPPIQLLPEALKTSSLQRSDYNPYWNTNY